MATKYVSCPACERHVRAADRECPFCAAAMPEPGDADERRAGASGLTRAAILFAGATAVAACSEPVPLYGPAPTDSGADTARPDTGPVPLYGPVPVDAGADGAGDAANDTGPPPVDAGVDVARDSNIVPLYGPAPVDAGNDVTRDTGGIVPLYGPVPVDGG